MPKARSSPPEQKNTDSPAAGEPAPNSIGPLDERSIQQRMVSILAALPAIGKDTRNPQQGFMFRSHDAVLNALNPLLARHGVFVVPDVIERLSSQRQTARGGIMYEVNLHVRFVFYGAAGDSLEASTWGEGTDSGDKATNKAMTMAFKNVLNQAFAISTQEFGDPDGESPPESVRHSQQESMTWIRPANFSEIVARLTEVQAPQELWTKWWIPQFIEASFGEGKRGSSDLSAAERERLGQQLTTTLYQLESLNVTFVEDQNVIDAFAVISGGVALVAPPAEGEKEWGLEPTPPDQATGELTPEEQEIERLAEEVFSSEATAPEEQPDGEKED